MPKVITAATAGFCFGVNRAVETVYEELKKNKGTVYTYGPIVHNEAVTDELERNGIVTVNSVMEAEKLKPGTMVIRAHGIPLSTENRLRELGFDIVDATCPFVKKIHRIVEEESAPGRIVIIAGDPSHPEVQGIRDRAGTSAVVIEEPEDPEKLELKESESYSLVAQTTFNYEKILEIIARLQDLKYDIKCFNTVCNATQERQKEAEKIASGVDAMIVIGSRNSSNTKKLYDICSRRCAVTVLIQSLDDLTRKDFTSVNSVGITAGASTPKHIIEEVQTYVRS